jgi:signal transduction histidine kinase/CheY-like chemotaxis protein/HPt (histidine-containing phosphotransfer) domain-containing protein
MRQLMKRVFHRVRNSLRAKIIMSLILLLSPVILILCIYFTEIITSKSSNLIIIAIVGIFFYLIFAYFIWRYISSNVINPVVDLIDMTKKLQKGEYGVKVGFENYDELTELACNLNKLSDTLATIRESLYNKIKESEQSRKALNLSKQKAELASKFKSQFLANMSHEIRTPMSGILGILQRLNKTNIDKRQEEFIQMAHESAKTLLRIIDDILDFSKLEAGKMEVEHIEVNLRETIEPLIHLLTNTAVEKEIELALSIRANTPTKVKTDPTRLKQVMTNLIGNAIKFTPRGGEVIATIELIEEHDDEGMLLINIQDTGVGIEEEAIKVIFDSFSQADDSITRKYGGTGLGLTLCKSLVKLMGGEISVTSKLGKGSHFSFTFKVGIVENEAFRPLPYGKRVLLISNKTHNNRAIPTQLEHWQLTYDQTNDLNKAYDLLFAKSDNKYSMIIIDIDTMGTMSTEFIKSVYENPITTEISWIAICNDESRVDKNSYPKCIYAFLERPIQQSKFYNKLNDKLYLDKYFPTHITKNNQEQQSADNSPSTEDDALPVKVLVVEDNLVNQAIAAEILEDCGCEVDLAENGQIAIDMYNKSQYDLILMDCQMPQVDGYKATRAIRNVEKEQNNPKTIIIALTANAFDTDRKKCLEVGMDDYMSKPFDEYKLKTMLKKYMDSSLLRAKNEIREHKNETQNEPTLFEQGIEEAFNLTIVERLIKHQKKGKESLFTRLKRLYLQTSPNLVDTIISENSSTEDIKIAAHTLKSASANIGAEHLSKTCGELEAMYKSSDYETNKVMVQFLTSSIKEQYDVVENVLKSNTIKESR